jgi:Flp pilus assembly protein TadG
MQGNLNRQGQRKPGRARERGQVLVMFALFLTVLLLFVGLGVDLGFAYITQARLAKAVDAAALAGMSNFYQGSATATTIADNTFTVNFSPNNVQPGYIQGTPTIQTGFSVDQNSNELFTVSATATMKTFFIGLAGFPTLNVSDSSTATRAPVAITLVLDHSNSMSPTCPGGAAGGCTGGGEYLPTAVANFISVFQDNVDQAAVVTFGSSVTNLLPMSTPFISAVTAAGNYLSTNWGGGTYSVGGLTNALLIENSVIVPTNQNLVKAVVFFTDGLANMIQASNYCPNGVSQLWNFGGYIPSETEDVDFFATNTAFGYIPQECGEQCSTLGYAGACNEVAPTCCNASTNKYQSFDGTMRTFTMDNVIYDATNQCLLVANQMKQAGIYVYCIGLTAAANGDVPDPGFLEELANAYDPANNPTYNPALPVGEALTSGNGADLTTLFQQIAGDIQLRLIH